MIQASDTSVTARRAPLMPPASLLRRPAGSGSGRWLGRSAASRPPLVTAISRRFGVPVMRSLQLLLVFVGMFWITGSAHASSLVFTKPDGNVWLANPDGSGQYQVTLDGTSANPYSSPTQASDGTIEAIRGTGSGAQIYRMTQNGTILNNPFTTAVPGTGPLDAVISPDGSKVAFWGVTGTDPCYPWVCYGTARTYQLSYADHYADPSTFNPGYAGWSSFGAPAWMGNDRNLLFTGSATMWYYDLGTNGPNEPVQWFYDNYTNWDGYYSGGPGVFFLEGAASQDGTRLALVTNNGYRGQYQIAIFSASGDLATGNPPAQPTLSSCFVPPPDGSSGSAGTYPGGALFDSVSWSPDGSSLAYEYDGAIYVAHIASLTDCSQDSITQVISSGSDPYWGPANINPQQRGTGGTNGAGGTNGTGGTATQPPSATTGATSGVSQVAATLTGTVNPNRSTVTSCHFDYGTSIAYGTSAPCAQTVGAGGSPIPVSATPSGLVAGTTYHYRLVAGNASGTSKGSDRTFTTRASVRHPCAQLRGIGLKRCLATHTYTRELASCDRNYDGSGKSAKAKHVACRKKVTTAYHRTLALIKCSQITNKHKHAMCVQQARAIRK